MAAPSHQSSSSTFADSSKEGTHSNLVLVLCIVGGIVIIAIIFLIIGISCAFRDEKPKPIPEDPGTDQISLQGATDEYMLFCSYVDASIGDTQSKLVFICHFIFCLISHIFAF